jgi:acyl-coenzyme A synthetase/AMP-(fatty) acid ligase
MTYGSVTYGSMTYGSITYGRLYDLVTRVAAKLLSDTAPGDVLATALPHSPAGSAALLGCLATGRLCIVLNAREPADRLAAMMLTARPVLTVGVEPALSIARDAGLRVLSLDDALEAPESPGPLPEIEDGPDAPTTVHFTSGSSGTPKGIVSSLGGILHRTEFNRRSLELRDSDAVIAVSRASTGSGLAFQLASLAAGARLLMADLATEGPGTLLTLMREQHASVLIFPAPVFRMLVQLPGAADAFAAARILRSGAAGLTVDDVASFRNALPKTCILSHTYASTEAGIVAEWRLPDPIAQPGPTIPAGYLAPEQEYALVDVDQTSGQGEVGELALRGPHIAMGEWQDGALISGRMSADPTRPGWRIFRTGDIVRIDTDGLLHFVTRSDRQIKINGARIEPAEIESVLRSDPDVSDAVVTTRVRPRGLSLHAFVAAGDADPASVRQRLVARVRAQLPEVMRPSTVMVLRALPTLPGGKIDTQGLLALTDPTAAS